VIDGSCAGIVNLLTDLCSSRAVCDARLMSIPPTHRYTNHRFPAEIIDHGVWLYFRICLSYRDVEELLLARGISVTYEAIRRWCHKFGQQYVNQLRRQRPRPGDKWHLISGRDAIFSRPPNTVARCSKDSSPGSRSRAFQLRPNGRDRGRHVCFCQNTFVPDVL
jgi:hypothetical protein